jgi:hypothetical protein
LALGAAGAIVAPALGSAAAPAASGWRLVDYDQRACFDTNSHDTWFGVFIKGTWTRPIKVGVKHLPAGADYSTSYTPIPPGSSSGVYSLASAGAHLAPDTPIGTYRASLWASDGSTRDHVRVRLDVKTDCSDY